MLQARQICSLTSNKAWYRLVLLSEIAKTVQHNASQGVIFFMFVNRRVDGILEE